VLEKSVIAGETAASERSDFEPVEIIDGKASAGILLICDHASNRIPASYQALGLSGADLKRHVAWDIGAAEVTRHLAAKLAAPAILSCFSRLLIDPNRGLDDPTLLMRLSDGRVVPGNQRADAAETAKRCRLYWQPYRSAIAEKIETMIAEGHMPAVVSVHSFTPAWKGVGRPWQAGILWDTDARLAGPLIEALRRKGLLVGDNEPYDGALKGDTLDDQVTSRGLAGCLVEIRQDLIAETSRAIAWAELLCETLTPILERPELHRRTLLPSRTGRHKMPVTGNKSASTGPFPSE
jgi:predicted N-formylglutamate amidohydrolase